ncbi:hypothetical protein CC2G_013543 [Coprinopsis cinerea AmutBmut pab1-1]|nr:hypothetical protein CC2G_013543 [Coprinopsis cinerea AmutBmut pab1-1]
MLRWLDDRAAVEDSDVVVVEEDTSIRTLGPPTSLGTNQTSTKAHRETCISLPLRALAHPAVISAAACIRQRKANAYGYARRWIGIGGDSSRESGRIGFGDQLQAKIDDGGRERDVSGLDTERE